MSKIRTLRLEDLPSNRAEVYEGETVRFTFDAGRYNYRERDWDAENEWASIQTPHFGLGGPPEPPPTFYRYEQYQVGDVFNLGTEGGEINQYDIQDPEFDHLHNLVLFGETEIDSTGQASWTYVFVDDGFEEGIETSIIDFGDSVRFSKDRGTSLGVPGVYNGEIQVAEKIELVLYDKEKNPSESLTQPVTINQNITNIVNNTNNTTTANISNTGSGNITIGNIGAVNK